MNVEEGSLTTREEDVRGLIPGHNRPARTRMPYTLTIFAMCLSCALAVFVLRASVAGRTTIPSAHIVVLAEKPWPPTCADAATDVTFATCYQNLNWARTIGIKENKEWYADSGGLTEDSSEGDWQNYFFNMETTKSSYMNNQWYCPPYCKKSMQACRATVDLYSSTAGNYVVGPVLDTFTIDCGACTQTPNGRYRADNCNTYGMECLSTLLNIVPCDDYSKYDVSHHEFSVYADGAVSPACCNVKTGGCGYSCKGRVARASQVPPAPAPAPSKPWPPSCADAAVDPGFSECLQQLRWAKEHGIKSNPEWYWSNLSESSSDADFQRFFFAKETTKASYDSNQWYCPPPCKEQSPACNVAVTLFAGSGHPTQLDSFNLKCDECTQTPHGRYKVEGCNQHGITCFTTLVNVVPCDDQNNGFSVFADGGKSYDCCNVKTGACGFRCTAYVG